jgi:hypothetical protein
LSEGERFFVEHYQYFGANVKRCCSKRFLLITSFTSVRERRSRTLRSFQKLTAPLPPCGHLARASEGVPPFLSNLAQHHHHVAHQGKAYASNVSAALAERGGRRLSYL